MIDFNVDKLILTNSFVKLEQELNNISLEEYDLILMFGINKFLQDFKIYEIINIIIIQIEGLF